MAIDITPRGLDFIKRKEGYFDKAYLCPAGVWTIGYCSIRWSTTQPVRKGDTCTQEQAERLLLREVQRTEDAIEATITAPLTPGQADCLISLFYNIGIGWLIGQGHQQATLVKLLNKGQYDRIPSEILKFKNANGKPLKGLLIRRQEEVRELWLGDYGASAADPVKVTDTDPAEAPMPQHVEPETGNVKEAMKSSWTLKGALLAFLATMSETAVDVYNWTFGVAKDAGVELTAIRQTIGPFDTILVTMKSALPVLAVVGIVIVVSRRLSAAREGKIG
jgi:lysozyme